MKKSIFIFLFVCTFLWATAGSKVIKNPAVEFQKSGIIHVSKVELSDTATLITTHNTFLPKWWIDFNKTDYIQDCETGKRYPIKSVIGGELGKRIWIPKSGDSTIVLAFEPLDKSVKKINFGESVWGISLDKKQKAASPDYVIAPEVKKWMDSELAKAPQREPIAFDSPDFYKADKAHLVGCIKGYDARAGFSTGIIYIENMLTRESYPIVVEIHPDGRLEAEIPMIHPQHLRVNIYHSWASAYMEPGQTLGMVLDWADFLDTDRYRNIRYEFKRTEYLGSLAQINKELNSYKPKQIDFKKFQKQYKELAPAEFKDESVQFLQKEMDRFTAFANENPLSNQAKTILSNEINLETATRLFDYVSRREYEARTDTANTVLKILVDLSYYSFLKELPLNNNSLLASEGFGTFINRFEYMKPLTTRNRMKNQNPRPEKSVYEFLKEEKIPLAAEDEELFILIDKKEKSSTDIQTIKEKQEEIKKLNEKYKESFQQYFEKYIKTIPRISMCEREISSWQMKDSLLRADLNLEPSLTYHISKIRTLAFQFGNATRLDADKLWSFLKKDIPQSVLIENGDHLFAKAFPDQEKKSYVLPSGHAADVFKKIIDPFKGKILFIDFWATTCGPCVAGIKKMKDNRSKYKDNPDFDFIFITEERASPEAAYKKLVDEQELKNTFRIPTDDYNFLRQLFKFNGIPHYVVIDKDGLVLDDEFSMYNFDMELPKILKEK